MTDDGGVSNMSRSLRRFGSRACGMYPNRVLDQGVVPNWVRFVAGALRAPATLSCPDLFGASRGRSLHNDDGGVSDMSRSLRRLGPRACGMYPNRVLDQGVVPNWVRFIAGVLRAPATLSCPDLFRASRGRSLRNDGGGVGHVPFSPKVWTACLRDVSEQGFGSRRCAELGSFRRRRPARSRHIVMPGLVRGIPGKVIA